MKLLPPPMAADPATSEVLLWLKTLPLAPEYHPTLAEFEDPIAYILKIEKEASRFGICKIIPPIPAASKKTAVANLNRSFAARNPNNSPTFTSRQQQIGFCPRRPRPVKKPVWQSGENYTLQQFEAKAKQFERTQFKKTKKKGIFTPLEIETLFWKACADKPFSVEYANDMPGSGFGPIGTNGKKWRTEEEKGNVGDTAWNMRGVSRAKGSLLRFMKEEIPGVTSPMAYVAMMFSWFAWHVEDHDLHSLNYLHLGAGKTWYGVPRDARLAFEEVVRVHGYGGEVNPLVTFAILGEKTTVMSPEVFIGAGIPCCRLVQNAGEFVVTFPGSYHSGFSHGFNCGEAANIATPEWLKVAKEAAIRRASTNYPPMVSHFQLLYALALSLCQRMPISSGIEPRSSRLKDKMRGEGEIMVKEMFVQNVIQNNMLLSVLLDHGSSCVVLSQNTSDGSSCSSSLVKSQIKVKPRMSLGLCSRQEAMEMPTSLSDDVMLDKNAWTMHLNGFCSVEGNSVSLCQEKKLSSTKCSRLGTSDFYSSGLHNVEGEKDSTLQGDGLLDQGLLSCVTCGILSFACVAVIQPREAAARYFMSADCSSFNDQIAGSMIKCNVGGVPSWKRHNYDHVSGSGQENRHVQDSLDDNLANCSASSVQGSDQNAGLLSDTAAQEGVSALDLLASAYRDSSDSEEEALHHMSVCTDANDFSDSSLKCNPNQKPRFPMSSENLCSSKGPREEVELHLTAVDCQNAAVGISENPLRFVSANEVSVRNSVCITGSELHRPTSLTAEDKCEPKVEFLAGNRSVNPENVVQNGLDDDREMAGRLIKFIGDPHSTYVCWRELHSSCPTTAAANDPQTDMRMGNPDSCCDSVAPSGNAALTAQFRNIGTPSGNAALTTQFRNIGTSIKNSSMSAMQRSDKDSSRMHVFCLEHAAEVEKQLHPIGGVHIMLLCHPEYPKIEAEAKLLAKELEINHLWKDIPYRDATKGDQERIRTAMEDEEAIPMNSDWAVKLGINLYYSANLSKSPLYSKQMPYNSVIYKSFGHDSPGSSPVEKPKGGGRSGMQKKKVVAGKWCGKVWMSNQVHPYLAHLNDALEHDQCSDEKPESETYTEQVNAKPNSLTNNTPSTRKSGKKRKKKPLRRKRSTKKPRFPKLDDNSDIVEDVVKNSSPQCGRFLRSCNGITARRHKSNSKDEADEGGPSSCLGRRRQSRSEEVNNKKPPTSKKVVGNEKSKKARGATDSSVTARDEDAKEYPCDIEGCGMNFGTKQDLALHKKNVCPVRGCGKKFFSHKYLVQHRKVHLDERPLKCPWKGCKMTFKWAWARTEHIRVHTGDRPYVCREAGCSQTFRFVSDFSRHKRKTGHLAKKGRGRAGDD